MHYEMIYPKHRKYKDFLLFSSIHSFVQPLTVLELYATIERVC